MQMPAREFTGSWRRSKHGGSALALASLLITIGLSAIAPIGARADLPLEEIGKVETLPTPFSPHWVWVTDGLMERMALVDLETSRMLGVVDGGWGLTVGHYPKRREFYVPETHYSRGSRGIRTDVLTFYDAQRLAPVYEVLLPPKRAMNPMPSANAALSDDEHFLAVFNQTPATSLSIVDLSKRSFVTEIPTPGCAAVYGAGVRRFAMLCADGAMLLVQLHENGELLSRERSEPFFDPEADPIMTKAARTGDRWVFASHEGRVYEVDVSGRSPSFAEPWLLAPDQDGDVRWRVGGRQVLAIHEASGRIFVLMHEGGVDSHKDDGTEVWVYDLASHERLERLELRSPGFTFMGFPLEFGQDWIWPFNGLYGWLIDMTTEAVGTAQIAVTQDDAPLLVAGGPFSGSLAIYDALTGEFLRWVATGNMTNLAIHAPPWPIPGGTAHAASGTEGRPR